MSLREYFDNHKDNSKDTRLESGPIYKETVKSFYEDFISPHLRELFEVHKDNFIKWCKILEDYANGENGLPIFWIRKFESGSGKENVNDNRRTGTTVIVDENNNAIASFAYISNFDAQELYNIVLNVDPSDNPKEFNDLMMSGQYKFHYDNGANSTESAITSFECLSHAKSFGVFNKASLYLAHIIDVNGVYYGNDTFSFEKGSINEWQEISKYPGYNFSNVFAEDPSKRIRVSKYDGNPKELRDFLKAHFFRFVHPFNYFLVPGKNYEVNAIFGKIQKSIGEYSVLTRYVRYRMYADFISHDSVLQDHYAKFENAILIDDSKKMSRNFNDDDTKESEMFGNEVIHVVYGTSVGKEGILFRKLSERITNADELYNLYDNYVKGDCFVFDDESGNSVQYIPKQSENEELTIIGLFDKLKTKLDNLNGNGKSDSKLKVRLAKTDAAKISSSDNKQLIEIKYGKDINLKERQNNKQLLVAVGRLDTYFPFDESTKKRFHEDSFLTEFAQFMVKKFIECDNMDEHQQEVKDIIYEIKGILEGKSSKSSSGKIREDSRISFEPSDEEVLVAMKNNDSVFIELNDGDTVERIQWNYARVPEDVKHLKRNAYSVISHRKDREQIEKAVFKIL